MRAFQAWPGLVPLAASVLLLAGATGCGDDCSTIISLTISPQSVAIPHSAMPPGNTQQFSAFAGYRCGMHTASSLGHGVIWETSDPVNTSITGDGTATLTCINATGGPVTITATTAALPGPTHAVSGTTNVVCE